MKVRNLILLKPSRVPSIKSNLVSAFVSAGLFIFALFAISAPVYVHFRSASANTKPSATPTITKEVQKTTAQAPTTAVTSSRTPAAPTQNLLPYDPHLAGPLQPSPDKPPIPKLQKPLVITPASITLYKNVNNAPGVEWLLESTNVDVTSGDGHTLYFPSSDVTSGIFLTNNTSDWTPRADWTLTAASNYASLGTTIVKVSATAVDGSAEYVGTLTVVTLPIPTFSIATTPLSITNAPTGFTLYITNFPSLSYSSGFDMTYQPTITLQTQYGPTFGACTIDSHGWLECPSITQLQFYGSYTGTVTLQNKFQTLTIPVTL